MTIENSINDKQEYHRPFDRINHDIPRRLRHGLLGDVLSAPVKSAQIVLSNNTE